LGKGVEARSSQDIFVGEEKKKKVAPVLPAAKNKVRGSDRDDTVGSRGTVAQGREAVRDQRC